MVSIAGASPSCTPQIDQMVGALIERHKYVTFCTNGVLMDRKLALFEPARYFAWAVPHRRPAPAPTVGVAGKACSPCRGRHQEGEGAGFRVTTKRRSSALRAQTVLGNVPLLSHRRSEVDQDVISPSYAYEKAPDQDHSPRVDQTQRLFVRPSLADPPPVALNHYSLCFLDLLEAGRLFSLHGLGLPIYSVSGCNGPVYPDVGRVRVQLLGAGWRRPTGQLRRAGPSVAPTACALRLRADGGLEHNERAAPVPLLPPAGPLGRR